MSKLRIVFMGTPDFAVPCLERLIVDGHEIVAVVTQPDRPKGRGKKLTPSPVKEAALTHGLTVLQPEKIREDLIEVELTALAPDVIVVVAFGQLLPQKLLELPRFGCINVHASLLPYYRGAAPIHWAVINGETVSGVTTMRMDVGIDTGPMILKTEVAIGAEETTGVLHDKLTLAGAETLSKTLTLLVGNCAPCISQPHNMATYAPMLTRKMELIDWQQSSGAIHNLVRGFNPWPGAYYFYKDKIVKVWQTKVSEVVAPESQPGMIVEINHEGVCVATGTGTLLLLEVQPESKRRMNAVEYARGYSLRVGDMLG